MTLSLDTAYRSFGGEVEASSTPTICRLPDSRRHQLWAIAQTKARRHGIQSRESSFAPSRQAKLHGSSQRVEMDRPRPQWIGSNRRASAQARRESPTSPREL